MRRHPRSAGSGAAGRLSRFGAGLYAVRVHLGHITADAKLCSGCRTWPHDGIAAATAQHAQACGHAWWQPE